MSRSGRTTETLFTGIVVSSADGAGSYVLEFFTPGGTVVVVADTAVTDATVNSSFTNLSMSWIDGVSLNTIVAVTGVDMLTSTFDATYPIQQLVFNWTGSVNGAGFRFDVETSPVPVPASVLLMGTAFAGFGFAAHKRRSKVSSAA